MCNSIQKKILFLVLLLSCVIAIVLPQESPTPITSLTNPVEEAPTARFHFKIDASDKYRIDVDNVQSIYIDGDKVVDDLYIANKVIVNVIDKENEAILLNYKIENIENGHLESEDLSEFIQYKNGKVKVPQRYLAPYVRSIPSFPDREISKGDMWSAIAQENFVVSDLQRKNLIDLFVNYTYVGMEDLPEDAYEVSGNKSIIRMERAPLIHAQYSVENEVLYNSMEKEYISLNSDHDIYIWWNLDDGRIEYYREEFSIRVKDKIEEREYRGTTEGLMVPIKDLDKSLDEIRALIITRLGNDDIEVEESDDGILLRMENINFGADSSELNIDELLKLEVIAEVIGRYRDRRILVEGHTALAGTKEARKELSKARAKVVTEELDGLLKGSNNQIMYRGWGADKPLSPNITEEGRAKNRRVEITILEN